jgi:ABC-type phosphate transport system substrate-binding protein
MKKLLYSFGFTLTFSLTSLNATQYALVASKDMQNISLGQVKALYLKKTLYIGDKKIIPLNLQAKDKIRKSFERNVLHMNFNRLKSYWSKQHYLGHRPPITMKSQNSIKAFVKKIDGAIGYIELSNLDDNLKILYKWSE